MEYRYVPRRLDKTLHFFSYDSQPFTSPAPAAFLSPLSRRYTIHSRVQYHYLPCPVVATRVADAAEYAPAQRPGAHSYIDHTYTDYILS